MKKYILSLTTLVVFITACNTNKQPEKNRKADSLQVINDKLQEEITIKDSTTSMFVNAFNEIQENLDSIKAKEKLIVEASKTQDVTDKKMLIKQSIGSIYEFMAKNRGAVAALSAKLKAANMNLKNADSAIAEMQTVIDRLTAQLDTKDKEVNELKMQLEKMKIELDNLNTNLGNKEKELSERTTELNTAFYKITTKEDLKKEGFIKKEGGVLGMGKVTKLKSDFPKVGFTQIDITGFNGIEINSKICTILTSHPLSSYTLVTNQNTKVVEKIVVKNQKEFWSASKYLIVETKPIQAKPVKENKSKQKK
jgi:hypothetical protein